jgi:hypothetical protein
MAVDGLRGSSGHEDVDVGVVLARESSRQSDSTAQRVDALGHVMLGLPPSSDGASRLRVASLFLQRPHGLLLLRIQKSRLAPSLHFGHGRRDDTVAAVMLSSAL